MGAMSQYVAQAARGKKEIQFTLQMLSVHLADAICSPCRCLGYFQRERMMWKTYICADTRGNILIKAFIRH
jgi:hypothetical protein